VLHRRDVAAPARRRARRCRASNALSRPMVPGPQSAEPWRPFESAVFVCPRRRRFCCSCALRHEKIAKQRRSSPNCQLVHLLFICSLPI
jgi:hypothetical protein